LNVGSYDTKTCWTITNSRDTYLHFWIGHIKEIITGSIILFFIVGILTREVIKGRKKIQFYEDKLEHVLADLDDQIQEPKVSREQIEEYIKEKLAEASLKSITENFQITTSQVYSILKPDKPGTIIQKLRIEMVLEMRNKRMLTKDIALATGLSPSYIRKLKIPEQGEEAQSD